MTGGQWRKGLFCPTGGRSYNDVTSRENYELVTIEWLFLSCKLVISPYSGLQDVCPLYVDLRLHAIKDFLPIPKPQNIQVLAHVVDVYGAVKCDLCPLRQLDFAHGGFEAQLLDLLL